LRRTERTAKATSFLYKGEHRRRGGDPGKECQQTKSRGFVQNRLKTRTLRPCPGRARGEPTRDALHGPKKGLKKSKARMRQDKAQKGDQGKKQKTELQ